MGQPLGHHAVEASPRPRAWVCTLLGLALCAAAAQPAWAIYKVVGPDGRVTFTDVPPASGVVQPVPGIADTPTTPDAALPPRLRDLQRQAPVVVYTTPRCTACDKGLEMLRERGIPYTEKTIATPQDAEAFKALDPDLHVPLLSVAGVRLTAGFDASAWNQALDAAGYPRKSLLPAGYRAAPAQPLVAPAASAASRGAPAGHPPVLPTPSPHAPPGFKF